MWKAVYYSNKNRSLALLIIFVTLFLFSGMHTQASSRIESQSPLLQFFLQYCTGENLDFDLLSAEFPREGWRELEPTTLSATTGAILDYRIRGWEFTIDDAPVRFIIGSGSHVSSLMRSYLHKNGTVVYFDPPGGKSGEETKPIIKYDRATREKQIVADLYDDYHQCALYFKEQDLPIGINQFRDQIYQTEIDKKKLEFPHIDRRFAYVSTWSSPDWGKFSLNDLPAEKRDGFTHSLTSNKIYPKENRKNWTAKKERY